MKRILPTHHDYLLEFDISKLQSKATSDARTERWKRLSQECRDRDKACQKCGYSEDKLDPHHIVYRNFINCTADDLILLCASCHNLWHKIQTPVPWIDWINEKIPTWDGRRKKWRGNPETRKASKRRYRQRHKDQLKAKSKRIRKRQQLNAALFKKYKEPFLAWLESQGVKVDRLEDGSHAEKAAPSEKGACRVTVGTV